MTPWRAVREWAAGLDLLAQNPANCSGVELLQAGAIVALALAALRALAAAFVLRAMRRGARPVARSSRLFAIYRRAAAELGVRRLPQLLVSREAMAPLFIAGVWRPFIVIDARVARTAPADELRVALLHELAHYRRGDNVRAAFVGPLTAAAVALTAGAVALQTSFGHRYFRFDFDAALPLLTTLPPIAFLLVRSIGARFALGREVACDDETVRATGDPLLVASALLSFATAAVPSRGATQPSHACLVTSGNVETRVRRLVAYRPPSRLATLSLQLASLGALVFVLSVVATR
ncbi:MAG TPA: M56 family metallopeptidase [Thermoanaerobaculia bacterium]|jgi:Zn-dependent protease with chaperone function